MADDWGEGGFDPRERQGSERSQERGNEAERTESEPGVPLMPSFVPPGVPSSVLSSVLSSAARRDSAGRGSIGAGPGAGSAARGGHGAGSDKPIELTGEARLAGPQTVRGLAKLVLEADGFTLEVAGRPPIRAGYRDLSVVAISGGTVLLVLGDGPDAMRWLLERFGDKTGPLVQNLRERRLRQQLADGLVELEDDPAELMEFEWQGVDSTGPQTGVGQLLVHRWGFVLAPIDERQSWIRYRRGAIATAKSTRPGCVTIDGSPGRLELRGLGSASTRWADTFTGLRDGAYSDAARFVEQLLPDAPFSVRRRAGELLVDGRPVRPEELGDAWETVEAAVLTEPGFAESYRALIALAGPRAPRWLAMSPEDPGSETPKIWFLVALPGNLVAMELVSEGAHATYCFRAMARASYAGQGPDALGPAADQTVVAISEALVDARFLREPMALPADQLRSPKYLRYRLALAELPTLADARRRFIARVVHSSPERWNAAIRDLIAWHSSERDEAAEWPGRSAQEAQVLMAGGEESSDAGDALDAGDASDALGAGGAGTITSVTGSPG